MDEQLLAAGKLLFGHLDRCRLITGAWSDTPWEELTPEVQLEFAEAIDAALDALPYE